MLARAPAQTAKRQVAQTYTASAPVGGLNARDAYAAMPPQDAITLDNIFPQPGWVELRNGYASQASGFSAWVETLLPYATVSAEHLFAISGGSIYDITTAGAIGSAVVTGLTNSRWESVNVATSGGQYLYACNATDAPQLYNGTTWLSVTGISSPIAITGVTTTTLRNPAVWKNRVWFVQDGTQLAWYLPTQAVGGAAASFDLRTIFRAGGQLQSIITCSLANGSTFDDYIFFWSSEGELAMYGGLDPAQAGLFVLQGVFRTGKPIGRRCWFRFGADLILICTSGFVSLQKLVAQGEINETLTINYKIVNLVNSDVQSYSGNFGWEGVVHPTGNKLIVNVPVSENFSQYQYVMNTITGSWCTFGKVNSPWNAACFCMLGSTLYFGSSNFVGKADTGQSDGGNQITGTGLTAYSYMNSDRQKQFTAIRPIWQIDGTLNAGIALGTDFNSDVAAAPSTSSGPVGSPWDTSPWDVSPWSPGFTTKRVWQTVGGIGFAGAIFFHVSSNAAQIRLMSIDYLYQPGGVL